MSTKIISLGDYGSGKSCLLRSYIYGYFAIEYETSIGSNCFTKNVIATNNLGETGGIKFQIWDTCNVEKYKSLPIMYYRGAAGILLCFDLTNEQSFNRCEFWLNEVHKLLASNCIIYLVGCKEDLNKNRMVPRDLALKFANMNSIKYFETSSKDIPNLNQLFQQLANDIFSITQNEKKPDTIPTNQTSNTFNNFC